MNLTPLLANVNTIFLLTPSVSKVNVRAREEIKKWNGKFVMCNRYTAHTPRYETVAREPTEAERVEVLEQSLLKVLMIKRLLEHPMYGG